MATSKGLPVCVTEPLAISAATTCSVCWARLSKPGPLSQAVLALAISPRKPVVLALARLLAMAVCRAIAPRIAVIAVCTSLSIVSPFSRQLSSGAQVDDCLSHRTCGFDGLGIGLKIPLCRNQRHKLFSDVDVGALKSAGLE